MNKDKTAVLCDSGCDVPQDYAEAHGIFIIPLIINYHDQSFLDTELERKDNHYVYKHFNDEIPKTAALNIREVMDVIEKILAEGYDKIIGVTISAAMSSTYQAVVNALRETEEEHPGVKTYAFDTKNISIGAGIFAMYASYELERGKTFDEVTKLLPEKIGDARLCYYMDTLEYLRKGGRITPSVAIVGKILNLKPIIACNREGVYYTVAKIRGSVHAVDKLLDNVIGSGHPAEGYWFAVMNGDGERFIEPARRGIEERCPGAEIVVDKQIVPTMAIHTGPGLLGILQFKL